MPDAALLPEVAAPALPETLRQEPVVTTPLAPVRTPPQTIRNLARGALLPQDHNITATAAYALKAQVLSNVPPAIMPYLKDWAVDAELGYLGDPYHPVPPRQQITTTATFEVPDYIMANTKLIPTAWLTAYTTTAHWPSEWLVTANSTGTTTLTSTATNYYETWPRWVTNQEAVRKAARRQPVTAEQRERMHQEEMRLKAKYEEDTRRYLANEAARKVAAEKSQGKAIELLLSALTEEQRKDLLTRDFFYVKSQKGNTYRIDRGNHRNVRLVDPQTRKVIRSYCAYATDGTYAAAPDGDSMLAQKLMLECMEEEFLKIANVFEHTPPSIANVTQEDFVRLARVGPLGGQARAVA